MNVARRIDDLWYGSRRGGSLGVLLQAASVPYRFGLEFREWLYRSELRRERRLPVPLVAVGNIVVGGTGKTPAVSWITAFFREAGRRPAVIARGYGGRCRGPARVGEGNAAESARLFGDEPTMMARRHPEVPVVIGRDRWAAGMEAVRWWSADVVIADDAFQHRRLGRDLDLVAVDAGRWFGNGRLFPGGPMREISSALARADVVLLTRVSSAGQAADARREELRRLAPDALIVEGEIMPWRWRRWHEDAASDPPPGQLYAFCGLANPGAFFTTLQSLKRRLCGRESFPDHHRFSGGELERIAAGAQAAGAVAAVTTEKDAVRIGSWPGKIPLMVLEVRLDIRSGRRELEEKLMNVAAGSVR